MNIILVWYLVVVIGTNGSRPATVEYSPPMPTLQMCEHLRNSLPDGVTDRSKCIQIAVVK